jgi:hypothetical protein
MRVSEAPVCIDLFRQNPVFTSLHLSSPVHGLSTVRYSNLCATIRNVLVTKNYYFDVLDGHGWRTGNSQLLLKFYLSVRYVRYLTVKNIAKHIFRCRFLNQIFYPIAAYVSNFIPLSKYSSSVVVVPSAFNLDQIGRFVEKYENNNLYKYDAGLFEEEICGTWKYAK